VPIRLTWSRRWFGSMENHGLASCVVSRPAGLPIPRVIVPIATYVAVRRVDQRLSFPPSLVAVRTPVGALAA